MRRFTTVVILAAGGLLAGCGGIGPTTFVHEGFDFGYIERVAVIPFENLSQDQGAGYRATRYFVSELLAAEAFDVVEPGEVTRVLEKRGLVRVAELAPEQIVDIGRELGVQGLILGSVAESSTTRSGSSSVVVVTVIARMVETDKGVTVWSTTHTKGGRGVWSYLFGGADESESEVTRRCVEETVGTLIR
jgi:TolB-like protein